jgi:hypothetical protein
LIKYKKQQKCNRRNAGPQVVPIPQKCTVPFASRCRSPPPTSVLKTVSKPPGPSTSSAISPNNSKRVRRMQVSNSQALYAQEPLAKKEQYPKILQNLIITIVLYPKKSKRANRKKK